MSIIGRALRSALDTGQISASVSRCCDAVKWVITATMRKSKSRR